MLASSVGDLEQVYSRFELFSRNIIQLLYMQFIGPQLSAIKIIQPCPTILFVGLQPNLDILD